MLPNRAQEPRRAVAKPESWATMRDSPPRVYASRPGRFLQPDPIGYGDGMNWYGYVGGDPVNLSDPSGLQDTGTTVVNGSYGCTPSEHHVQYRGCVADGKNLTTSTPTLGNLSDNGSSGGTAGEQTPQSVPCPPWAGQPTPAPREGDGNSQNAVAAALPYEATFAYLIGNEAKAATAVAYPQPGRSNNAADAYRHFYWSFDMTNVMGAQVAEVMGTAHEQNPDPIGPSGHYMDYYNNAVARWAA